MDDSPVSPETWKPLGMISNEKPSAVFKLSIKASSSSSSTTTTVSSASMGQSEMDIEIPHQQSCCIGISIEPISSILPQLPSASTSSSPFVSNPLFAHSSSSSSSLAHTGAVIVKPSPSFSAGADERGLSTIMAGKMIENFMNFILSFSVNLTAAGSSSESYIPLKKVNEWYEAALSKIKHDPNFLKKILEN